MLGIKSGFSYAKLVFGHESHRSLLSCYFLSLGTLYISGDFDFLFKLGFTLAQAGLECKAVLLSLPSARISQVSAGGYY